MTAPLENPVTVTESGNGSYAQFVKAGRHVMSADEPEAFGGQDTGPSPYEYVMAGLGACTAMTLRMLRAATIGHCRRRPSCCGTRRFNPRTARLRSIVSSA